MGSKEITNFLFDVLRSPEGIRLATESLESTTRKYGRHASRTLLTMQIMGELLDDVGNASEADYVLREAIRLKPNDASIMNRLAWHLAAYTDSGYQDPITAVDLARQAVNLEPKNPHYWNTLGVAQYRSADYLRAIESLRQAELFVIVYRLKALFFRGKCKCVDEMMHILGLAAAMRPCFSRELCS